MKKSYELPSKLMPLSSNVFNLGDPSVLGIACKPGDCAVCVTHDPCDPCVLCVACVLGGPSLLVVTCVLAVDR